MGVQEVKFIPQQLDLFWYWINERQRIFNKRKAGEKYPWTEDKILRDYKFTNAYREQDRVTQEWKLRYMKLLSKNKKPEDILFHLIMFRLFNWPETYDALAFNMKGEWNLKDAVKILDRRKNEDYEQIFTGAYIVTAGTEFTQKHEFIANALDIAYEKRRELWKAIKGSKRSPPTMQHAWKTLLVIPSVGPFVSYELVCDLRHTKLLSAARDINTWANAGPGAMRGIHRLLTGSAKKPKGVKIDYNWSMHRLWKKHKERVTEPSEFPFEMREIEHSLCEFDKYMRVKNGEGKPRSRFKEPVPQEDLFRD